MPGDSANDLLELPRRNLPPIKVWVTLEERAEIEVREPRRDCRRLPLLRLRSHHDETERQYLFT